MRPRISIRGSVRPSVRRSVTPSQIHENRRNKPWETTLFDTEEYLYHSREATADTTPTTASHTTTKATTATTITLLSSRMPKADNHTDETKKRII